MSLADGTRVVVVGAGPAGGFFACLLLDRCRQEGRDVALTLVDIRDFARKGQAGCSMCAGALSHSLLVAMEGAGLAVPESVIQRRIVGYRFDTMGMGIDLYNPPGVNIYTAFRGGGPRESSRSDDGAREQAHPFGPEPDEMGFDEFLLREAMKRGASHLSQAVSEIERGADGAGWVVQCHDGTRLDADLLVIACGVHTALLPKIRGLDIGYRAPRLGRSWQAEIALDPEFITERFREQIHVFFPNDPRIEFIAITPKRQHITVTMVGRQTLKGSRRPEGVVDCTDSGSADGGEGGGSARARFDGWAYLTHALAEGILRDWLPDDWRLAAYYCRCRPTLPVSLARHPYAEGLIVVGDACAQRYLKNGLHSAFTTARFAVDAVIEHGLSAAALRRYYARLCLRTYAFDNLCGRIIFRWNRLVTHIPFLARAHLRVAREEQTLRPEARHVVTRILWNIFTGNVPYTEIMKDTFRPSAVWAIAKGTWGEMRDRGRNGRQR